LKENIYTIPNFLTLSRLACSPYIGYLIVQQQYEWALIGCLAFGATDFLDGYIARRFKMQSVVGSILDPAADKALMTVLTVSLAMGELLPLPLAALILARDAGLVISAFYYRYISLPPPKTLVRYFDFSLPSAEIHPTTISKINTGLQLGLMVASLVSPVFGVVDSHFLKALQYTVGATTVMSGFSYIRSKDAVKILSRKQQVPKDPQP
ncbi:CDP-alcohol phosphatidyltransferase-domain-containing protein, partial [Dimargaris cristalligena]